MNEITSHELAKRLLTTDLPVRLCGSNGELIPVVRAEQIKACDEDGEKTRSVFVLSGAVAPAPDSENVVFSDRRDDAPPEPKAP